MSFRRFVQDMKEMFGLLRGPRRIPRAWTKKTLTERLYAASIIKEL